MVAVLSVYVLFWPSPAGSSVQFPGADKLVHAGLFLLLAASARLRFGSASGVLTAVLVYAALSELVQAVLLPGRSGDVLDLLADSAGALVGWQLARRWRVRTAGRLPGPRPGG